MGEGKVVPLAVVGIERGGGGEDEVCAAVLRVFPGANVDGVKIFLARLWREGFRVVPVTEGFDGPVCGD